MLAVKTPGQYLLRRGEEMCKISVKVCSEACKC